MYHAAAIDASFFKILLLGFFNFIHIMLFLKNITASGWRIPKVTSRAILTQQAETLGPAQRHNKLGQPNPGGLVGLA
jgi:hypothetical protein